MNSELALYYMIFLLSCILNPSLELCLYNTVQHKLTFRQNPIIVKICIFFSSDMFGSKVYGIVCPLKNINKYMHTLIDAIIRVFPIAPITYIKNHNETVALRVQS